MDGWSLPNIKHRKGPLTSPRHTANWCRHLAVSFPSGYELRAAPVLSSPVFSTPGCTPAWSYFLSSPGKLHLSSAVKSLYMSIIVHHSIYSYAVVACIKISQALHAHCPPLLDACWNALKASIQILYRHTKQLQQSVFIVAPSGQLSTWLHTPVQR